MRALRIVAAVALASAAALLVLLAWDVLTWRDAVRSGDRAFAHDPAAASWRASTILPPDPARDLLGLAPALRLRAVAQQFSAVQAAGTGYDNGLSESRTRGELEGDLANLGQSGNRVIASSAENMLGILAFADATQSGPIAPAPVEQSVGDFQTAIRLDPTNTDAKFNLELLLRKLLAKGVRPGSDSSSAGLAKGHHGAGGGIPGRGY